MKIKKPWSWVVSVIVVLTMPIWILPAMAGAIFWHAVESFHNDFFKD